MYTFHLEAVADPAALSAGAAHPDVCALAAAVRAAGMQVGIALKPQTPAELAAPYVEAGLVDMVRRGKRGWHVNVQGGRRKGGVWVACPSARQRARLLRCGRPPL